MDKSHSNISNRNEPHWAAYIIEMAQYTQEQIGFLDETSKDQQMPRIWVRVSGSTKQKVLPHLDLWCTSTLLKYSSSSSLVTVAVWGKQLQTVIYTFVFCSSIGAGPKLSHFVVRGLFIFQHTSHKVSENYQSSCY